MNIGQQLTTTINGIEITAEISNISAEFVRAVVVNPPAEWTSSNDIAWRIDAYIAGVSSGAITESN